MKQKILSFFLSLETAYYALFGLVLIFGIGSYLATTETIKPIFSKMTDIHVWAALMDILATPVLFVWLVCLIICAVILFFNTLCCTSQQLSQYAKRKSNAMRDKRLRGMAYIHIVALLVIIFHAVDVIFVQRHEPVQLQAGDQVQLGEYEVRVNAIEYITERSYITEGEDGRRPHSFKIPNDQFSISGNKADVALLKDGEEVHRADLHMFQPVRVGGTFFILDGFVIAYGTEQVSVLLHRVHNPIALPFFGLYGLLFSLFLYQCVLNRYRPARVSAPQRMEKN